MASPGDGAAAARPASGTGRHARVRHLLARREHTAPEARRSPASAARAAQLLQERLGGVLASDAGQSPGPQTPDSLLRSLTAELDRLACHSTPTSGAGPSPSGRDIFSILAGSPGGPLEISQALLHTPHTERSASPVAATAEPAGTRPTSGDASAGRPEGDPAAAEGSEARRLCFDGRAASNAAEPSQAAAVGPAERPRPEAHAPPTGASSPTRLQQGDWSERLSKPATERQEKWARMKAEAAQQELQECTFAPRILQRPRSAATGARPGLPVGERLSQRSDAKQQQVAQLRAERQRRELQGCTFQPATNRARAGSAVPPLQQRLADLQHKRSERRLRAQEAQPQHSFAPQINARSAQLALRAKLQRLQSLEPHAQDCCRQARGSPDAECSFQPRVNAASEQLLGSSRAVPADFLSRQRFFHDLRQRRLRQLQQSEEERAGGFQPGICPVSELIVAARRAAAPDTPAAGPRGPAAAGPGGSARRGGGEAFSFRPQINARSQKLAQGRSLEHLISASLQPRQPQQAPDLQPGLTFQPGADAGLPSTCNLDGKGWQAMLARNEHHAADREARLAAQRLQLAGRELEGCSFRPSLRATRPAQQGPVVVRGLQQFLSHQEAAKRQKQDLQRREDEVFHRHPQLRNGATVPQAPSLSLPRAPEDVERGARQQSEACSFKPVTNEGRKQALLDLLMR